MTDQLCGGRGLPEEGKEVVFWTDFSMHMGTRKGRAFFSRIDNSTTFPSGVAGWSYLSEVREIPERERQRAKMIAALERQVSNIDHWLSTGEAASPEESKSIYEQMHQALADAKGGA